MGLFLDSYPSYPNSCLSQSTLQINKHKHFKQNRGYVFRFNNCKIEHTDFILTPHGPLISKTEAKSSELITIK